MTTKVISVLDGFKNTDDLNAAAETIRRGGLVVFPTETVYGLGGDATNENSAEKIYAAKGRPSDNPLIIHIAKPEDAEPYAKTSEIYYRLANAFMPGPLTVVLPRKETIPLRTTGGLQTVAVRCPSHKVARELIDTAGVPIAAPSANLSGKPSPTCARHVIEDLSVLSQLLGGRWRKTGAGGYHLSSDLISGDNILIVQRDVPDFWFEQTGYGTPETYTYTDADGNETVYPLVVYEYAGEGETPYRQLGLLHILESDYTVIEGYSKSASQSAREAAAAVETVEGHLEETEERFSSLEDRMHTAEYTLRRHTRTLVFDTFESFFHFIDMGEDTFVSGVQTSTKDMKHGDVVRILEDGVPDFWYERNSAPPRLLYNYKGKNYQMYVCSYAGMTLYGVMRPIRSCADVALGEIDAALDSIIEIQNALIGGDAE